MSAKLVPVDCEAKKIPIHSYKHSGNEATFLIPEDSPTCTYEVMGTQIKVIKAGKPVAEAKAANGPPPKQTTPSTPK